MSETKNSLDSGTQAASSAPHTIIARRLFAFFVLRPSSFRVVLRLYRLPFTFCLLPFIFAFALGFAPVALHAQGCAMCYTSASAAREGAKNALANGTLILLAPPMLFFALIIVVLYRYRNKFRDTAAGGPEHDRDLPHLFDGPGAGERG